MKLKNIIQYIALILSSILLIVSIYLFYNNITVESWLNNDFFNEEVANAVNYVDTIQSEYNIDIKDYDYEPEYMELQEYDIRSLILHNWINDYNVEYDQCIDTYNNNDDINKCLYAWLNKFFLWLLHNRWVVDRQTCDSIEYIYWDTNTELVNRCKFIYAVNKWTKFFSIKACEDLPKITDYTNYLYTYENCVDNIIYWIDWTTDSLWVYLQTLRNRWKDNSTILSNKIENKNATLIDWKMFWTEIKDVSIEKALTPFLN